MARAQTSLDQLPSQVPTPIAQVIQAGLQEIEKLEDSLWAAADNLRANSKLTSSEYCMPVLGVIFLRHATNRFDAASRQIAEDQAAGRMPKRPLVKQDFIKRRALMLPNEARYNELLALPKGLSSSTAAQHHAILSGALKAAELEGLVVRNVAKLVVKKPQQRDDVEALRDNCWTGEEARAFLAAAEEAGSQSSAFFALALDTGARKGELCGLRWADVDLARATITITRQLLKPGRQPVFGTPKRERPRVIDLAPETVARLKSHRRAQAELKLRNRTAYHDLGLVFAKEWGDLHRREDSLGLPLQSNNLGQREFARVIKAAKVRPITFHGLRQPASRCC